MSERILIVGATSGIGRALSRAFASAGSELVLAGRDEDALSRIASDARLRSGRRAAVETFDAAATGTHEAFLDACAAHLDGFDGVVLCHGAMVEQADAEPDPEPALAMFAGNVTGTVSLLERIARRFE